MKVAVLCVAFLLLGLSPAALGARVSADEVAAACCGTDSPCCCASDEPEERDADDCPVDGDPCDCANEPIPAEARDLPPAMPRVPDFACLPPADVAALQRPTWHMVEAPRAPPRAGIRWGPRVHVWHCVFLL